MSPRLLSSLRRILFLPRMWPCVTTLSKVLLGLILLPNPGIANDSIWNCINQIPPHADGEAWVQPAYGQRLVLHESALRHALQRVPMEGTHTVKNQCVLSLPAPSGKFERFEVVETAVMHPDLAAKFPEIRTFSGIGLDDPYASLRMDITPKGLHAQVLSPRGSYYIDPYWKNDTAFYTCYRKDALRGKSFSCGVVGGKSPLAGQTPRLASLTTGSTLQTYRLAVTGQGEYTVFHGGTVAGAMAAIVTTINRVNGIYENDLAVRLQLVANNNLIIYTNPATDPFSLNNSSGTTLNQNQSNTDSVIGSSNYDVGHIFNTGGGGLAGNGVVCFNPQKAEAATGSATPMGDAFDVDFVAHELGHQFGADHTFNGVISSCSGNRNGATAHEIGSGTTIMGYAGICGVDNVQVHADPYFHAVSLEQIFAYLSSRSCEVATSTGNAPPSVNAGSDYTIPKETPFKLIASGTDADGDILTYCWEEMDLGPAQMLSAADNGSSPIFRSFPPTTDPTRTFPRLADLLSNTTTDAEKLPALARTMTWRVTARDNRMNGGGTDSDEAQITVAGGAGPFLVTSPNTALTLSGSQNITWDPANTQNAPVSTTNVNIHLSLNGGLTFDVLLAANTPNDGSHTVTFPSVSNSQARIRIESADNIFFDVSDVDFNITPNTAAPFFVDGGGHSVVDGSGNGNGNGRVDPGESSIQLFLSLNNSSTVSASNVSAMLSSLSPNVTIVTGTAAYPNIAGGTTKSNLTAYSINVDSSHPCGLPISLRLNVTANEGDGLVDLSIPTGTTAVPVTQSFTPSTAIPDGLSVDIPFSVAHTGIIADLDFRFDGTVCSTDESSALVGLNHSWVGDLTVTLISPSGRRVRMIERAGGGDFGSSGNNFCQTSLDDDGAFPSIQSIAANGADAPHTGTWLPANPLSEFDGDQANGNWTLQVSDAFTPDNGNVNAFSLILTLAECSPTNPVYTVTSSSGTNGTIVPMGSVFVAGGSDTNFQITADPYYHILEVTTNSTPIGQTFGPGVTNFNYVWSNVLADGTIDVSFSENLATNETPEWWLAMFGLTNGSFDVEALADVDGDGVPAWQEYQSGTDPTTNASVFKLGDVELMPVSREFHINVSTVPGRDYRIEFLDGAHSNLAKWASFGDLSVGVGTWTETGAVESVFTFVDDFSTNTSGHVPDDAPTRFYRVTTSQE